MNLGVGETVLEALKRLLPRREAEKVLDVAPPSPADVFASSASLLRLSGAYHHVQADGDGGNSASPRILHVDQEMRNRAKAAGDEWRKTTPKDFSAPNAVQILWTKLCQVHGMEEIFVELQPTDQCPVWWSVALELMLSADEAVAEEIGWLPVTELKSPWGLTVSAIVQEELNDKRGYLHTIAFETNQDIANVLPKSRTPSVGCTLRSLSHHLALLPPRGVARAYWIGPVSQELPASDALNLLIVPFPYYAPARSFIASSPVERVRDRRWAWFSVEQTWLGALQIGEFSEWVEELISVAEKDCKTVHGVVLPELAIDWKTYEHLAITLETRRGFELLIAGISSNETGRVGNFVATTLFGKGKVTSITRTREKHHRWKLDADQISSYALSSALQPVSHWWEKLDIMSRSLDVFVFRKDSSLTTLICEDLARVDPCQELVRSIGPNLVVALLMDGAQIKERWPARYATVLAEDPGSSVLTVNCRALLDRANSEARGQREASNAIALWRDDKGVRCIEAGIEADAVLLTLAGHEYRERTMDGRQSNPDALTWRYHGQQPIGARSSANTLRTRIRNVED